MEELSKQILSELKELKECQNQTNVRLDKIENKLKNSCF